MGEGSGTTESNEAEITKPVRAAIVSGVLDVEFQHGPQRLVASSTKPATDRPVPSLSLA